jgi:hypothetical protein
MKAILLLACIAVVAAKPTTFAPSTCMVSAVYDVPNTTETIGCNGYNNNVNITWNLHADIGRLLEFQKFDTEPSYDFLMIFSGTQTFGPFSGNATLQQFAFGPGLIRVTFITDGSNTRPGFLISITPAPNVHNLVSMQPFSINSLQPGGFVFFQLPANSMGSRFGLIVEIFTYQGLKEPGLFVSVNRLPSLEHYDYTNTTVQQGTTYRAYLTVTTPRDGSYYVGVFLYGTAAKMTVTASWTFNIPFLQSSIKVTDTVSNGKYYQIGVPFGTANLVYQISRQVPGGYPIAYIAQGYVPTRSSYQYIMDTRAQSYISLPIHDPNPFGSTQPNPGNYIIALFSADTANAGYILQADWI